MTLSPSQFQKRLLTWFDAHGRKTLPWQHNKIPYRVWVSEIMLQQTQVKTVIPYFERFMQRFPTLKSLAEAEENAVLHAWTGLGYYSRARNLHRAAKMVMQTFNGAFPNEVDTLQTLPGIGQSTAGAIISIAFEKQATILDGNVKRVLTRIHGITDAINDKATEKTLWEIATRYTPKKRVADYSQAIMDLGATFCTRSQPQCDACPFMKACVAYQHDLVEMIPAKKVAKKLPVKQTTFLILQHGKKILLLKRPSMGIWGGLYCMPELSGMPDIEQARKHCRLQFKLEVKKHTALPSFRHTFSHYHLDIHPLVLDVGSKAMKVMEDGKELWYNLSRPESIGLPKPVQMLLRELA